MYINNIVCTYVGFVATNFDKDAQVSFGVYRVVHMGSIGVSSILAFLPLKIYQIILCSSLIVFALLHLLVKRLSKETDLSTSESQ